MDNKPYAGTQAVTRAISVLNAFSDDQPEWNLTDLAKTLELNRTTTYRLLTALESFDLVARDPDTERYRLGSGIIVLAGRALRANPARSLGKPELEKLVAVTGETATLEILSGHEMLVIDEILGDRLMRSALSIGARWPAFAASTGNAVMAYLPAAELEAILQGPLPQLTSKTITSPEALRQRLPRIREDGYAVVAEALEPGFVAVGAPVCNYDGYPVAAISLGGPTIRLTEARIPEIGVLVREAAARISKQLGYRP
ncbi:MAG TPA: IclR family transcriptional regulator [Chloroflexi bacterium]|nr:IclR family transcriptional regulator [Chloroflexota bacterium]